MNKLCRARAVRVSGCSGPSTRSRMGSSAAFAGWMAERESARRGERIKAGLARRQAEGKPVGRQPGAGLGNNGTASGVSE